jgi:3-phosphoshikimate 1-carboxyvinyltransferase
LTTELNSKPYVDMTISIMKDFGVEVERNGYQSFTVHPIPITNYHFYYPLKVTPPPPRTSSPPLPSAAGLCAWKISRGNPCKGDIDFLDILVANGLHHNRTDNCILVTGHSSLTRH